MLIRILATTLLQIFCKIILILKVITKSIIDADDNIWRNFKELRVKAECFAGVPIDCTYVRISGNIVGWGHSGGWKLFLL